MRAFVWLLFGKFQRISFQNPKFNFQKIMWNLSPSSFILVSRCVHLIRWEGNITPPLSLIPSQEFFLKKGMSLNFMLHWISEHLEYQNIWNIRTFGISEHLKYQNIITLWKDPNVSHTFECFLCLFRIKIWKGFLFWEIFVTMLLYWHQKMTVVTC